MPADLVIYAVVAAGLVFWLRNLLGTRHDDERDRPNPFVAPPENIKNVAAEPTVSGLSPALEGGEDMGGALDRTMAIDGAQAESGLVAIGRADRSFELAVFLRGAQEAFAMIIEAFAAGDKATLRDLLSEQVYAAFCRVIDDRAAKGERAAVEIHAIRRTEVVDAQVRGRKAFITVRFTADETSIVRDAAGSVIFGDPDRITETIDLWTFGRDIKSRDPAWLLYETREDAGDELAGSTVPGAESKY